MTIEKMEKAQELKNRIDGLKQIVQKLNDDWTASPSGPTEWGIALGQLPRTGERPGMLINNRGVQFLSGIFITHSEDGSEGCRQMEKFRDYLGAYFEAMLDAAQEEFDAL
jgi:hypothetical protein